MQRGDTAPVSGLNHLETMSHAANKIIFFHLKKEIKMRPSPFLVIRSDSVTFYYDFFTI